MRFRPCIDIHDGKVKQIVGGTLTDTGAGENFVSEHGAGYFAGIYKENNLSGGHIILLNPKGSPEYEADKKMALEAIDVFPNSMQVGGGITLEDAGWWIEHGAGEVILTSWLFDGNDFSWQRLRQVSEEIGRDNLVVDISCRKREGLYYVVKDRWQTFTSMTISPEIIEKLSEYTKELLVHAVDQEGKQLGIDPELIELLAKKPDGLEITYAGGVASLEDISKIKMSGKGKVDFTVGSALSLFGGKMDFDRMLEYIREIEDEDTGN